ncbi:hypothetical protein MTO96_022555 [Rhipicephalus appendiculatus]
MFGKDCRCAAAISRYVSIGRVFSSDTLLGTHRQQVAWHSSAALAICDGDLTSPLPRLQKEPPCACRFHLAVATTPVFFALTLVFFAADCLCAAAISRYVSIGRVFSSDTLLGTHRQQVAWHSSAVLAICDGGLTSPLPRLQKKPPCACRFHLAVATTPLFFALTLVFFDADCLCAAAVSRYVSIGRVFSSDTLFGTHRQQVAWHSSAALAICDGGLTSPLPRLQKKPPCACRFHLAVATTPLFFALTLVFFDADCLCADAISRYVSIGRVFSSDTLFGTHRQQVAWHSSAALAICDGGLTSPLPRLQKKPPCACRFHLAVATTPVILCSDTGLLCCRLSLRSRNFPLRQHRPSLLI